MRSKYEDYVGKVINGIFVKDIIHGSTGTSVRLVCECPMCNKEYSVRSDHFKRKVTPYCTECADSLREDLTGQRFGCLTVDHMIYPRKYKRTLCSCSCDCGTRGIIIQANHLKSGETKSCGCSLSSGEEQLALLFNKYNIVFKKQEAFPGLRYKHPLRCDFYLPEYNVVVEYNGEQHYRPLDFFGGEKVFLEIQLRDRIKKEYCEKNGIKHLVVRFDDDIEECLIKNNIIMKR